MARKGASSASWYDRVEALFTQMADALSGGGSGGTSAATITTGVDDSTQIAALTTALAPNPTTFTQTNVWTTAEMSTSRALFAANANAKTQIINNETNATLYVAIGAAASATSYTWFIPAASSYAVDPWALGLTMNGIAPGASSGNVRAVTGE